MYCENNVYLICAFAAIGGGLFGLDISSMSGILGTQAYKRYFNHPTSYTQGAITASMPLGSMAGSMVSSVLADNWSRKAALQISCVFWIVGSAIQCGSVNVAMLCVGRGVAGLCVGIASSIVPIYQAEIAPKEIRGRVVSLQQWAITWGILIQYFVQYGAAHALGNGPDDPDQTTAAFRIPWSVQSVPAMILFVGLFFFPHSPRWLATCDRWDECLVVLANLHGKGDMRHPRVLAQYREIEDALREERRGTVGWKALMQRRILKRVVLGVSIQAWSQLCGMNIMMYYIMYIMEATKIASPLLTASIQYIINMLLTLPAILFLDKIGRRPALVGGSFALMTLLFVSGAIQQYYGRPLDEEAKNRDHSSISWSISEDHHDASVAIVTCSYLFVAVFATTWGPTSWTYPAEIFPSTIRARAVSLSTAANWACNAILAFLVPPMIWRINYKTYYIFGGFNGIAFVHMFFAAHETKGYTLEEMDSVFDAGIPAWRTKKPKSQLDNLEQDIRRGSVAVTIPTPSSRKESLTFPLPTRHVEVIFERSPADAWV